MLRYNKLSLTMFCIQIKLVQISKSSILVPTVNILGNGTGQVYVNAADPDFNILSIGTDRSA